MPNARTQANNFTKDLIDESPQLDPNINFIDRARGAVTPTVQNQLLPEDIIWRMDLEVRGLLPTNKIAVPQCVAQRVAPYAYNV
jgi:hypothetical protein